MGAFGRNRISSLKHTYRGKHKSRSSRNALKEMRSRGYGFAYGYVRKNNKPQRSSYARVSDEYFKYGRYK